MSSKKKSAKKERTSTVLTPKEHIKRQSMWAGKKEKASELVYFLDTNSNKFVREREEYSPALFKTIDEIVVNAIDHSIQYPELVKNIKMSFNEETGKISVYNDGPGISVNVGVLIGDPYDKLDLKFFETMDDAEEFCEEHSEKQNSKQKYRSIYATKWHPQILTEQPFSGKNFKSADEIHVRGGTNGIGMKIVNYFSKWFQIETIDLERKKYYSQVFEDGANIIHKPDIYKSKHRSHNLGRNFENSKKHADSDESDVSNSESTRKSVCEGTCISFIPDYKTLGYKKDFNKISKNDRDIIFKLTETRAYQAAAYVSNTNVYFQNELIAINSLKMLVDMHVENTSDNIDDYMFVAKIKPDPKRPAIDAHKMSELNNEAKKEMREIDWSWDVCITPNESSKNPERFSLINGVFVPSGMHITYIEELLVNAFRPKVEQYTKQTTKRWSDSYITNNVNIFLKGCIDSPSFDSQSKSNLKERKSKFEGYSFKPKHIKQIWNLIESDLLRYIGNKSDSVRSKNKTKLNDIDKHKGAIYAGCRELKSKPKGFNSNKVISLFIPEGDSAKGLIDEGLSNEKLPEWEWEYNGYYIIGGVPINARRFLIEITDKKTKETYLWPKGRLMGNERLNSLVKVLGLDYKKSYKNEKERQELRYDRIIIAVDQDTDGKGNICSLILGFISKFWPNLVKHKFVQRMNTPIMRAYSKKLVKESKSVSSSAGYKICKNFYSLGAFDKWVEDAYNSSTLSKSDATELMMKDWELEYFKGLAATPNDAIFDIFLNMEKYMIIYKYTKESEKWFDTYLGFDSSKRKKELKTSELFPVPFDQTFIACEHYLKSDLKEYQRENIQRSLPHGIDGLNPSRRKVLYAGMRYFGDKNIKQKVEVFGGEVIKTMHYQHGAASLNSTITKLGQTWLGSNNLPFFKGVGLGHRKCGGKDASAPRYAKIHLNKGLTQTLFPHEDNWMLKYTFLEGHRVEPDYYVPIFPTAIIENIQLPAHGWMVCSWARDWKSIMENIEEMINGEISKPCIMEIDEHNWSGDLMEYGDRLFSVGKYKYCKKTNIITITELPHSVFSEYVVEGNKKKEKIKLERKTKSGLTNSKSSGHEYDLQQNWNSSDDEDTEIVDYTIANKPVVKSIVDKSNDKDVNIQIKLIEGGYETIVKSSKTEWDPVIDYFHLKRIIYDNLNFLDKNQEVKEYKKYQSLFRDWYKQRKQLYIKRVNRRIIMLELQIELKKWKNKFSKNFDRFDLGDKTDSERNEILSDKKYKKFDASIVTNPKFIPVDKIKYYATEHKAMISYDYIHDLKQRETSINAIEKRTKDIEKFEDEIKDLKVFDTFKGDRMWLCELQKLKKIITAGYRKGWNYNEPKVKFSN